MNENEITEAQERLQYIGNQAEKKIFRGEELIITETDRVWLKKVLGEHDLSSLDGKAMLSEQAMKVAEVLGKEKTVGMTKIIVMEMLRDHGNVFGKGGSGNAEEVGNFVETYLNEQIESGEVVFDPKKYKGDGEPGSNWRMNTVYRIEAVLSVLNKILWIVGAEDEEETRRRQGTQGVMKHLRERVLRGLERAGEVIDEEVPRINEKVIRFLPKSGLAKVFGVFAKKE